MYVGYLLLKVDICLCVLLADRYAHKHMHYTYVYVYKCVNMYKYLRLSTYPNRVAIKTCRHVKPSAIQITR